MSEELYRKYRPTKLSEFIGQEEAIAVIKDMDKRGVVPHVLLMTGTSGTGKTSMGRLIAARLGCGAIDLHEMNCADSRGIDDMRDIAMSMSLAPMNGKVKVYLMDEVGLLTSPAQSSLLKVLEDTPKHVYFILCTTDPQKLLKTLTGRCTEVNFKTLSVENTSRLVLSICEKEGKKVPQKVVQAISEMAQGSARKALVLLHSVIGLDSEEAQLSVIGKMETEESGNVIELYKQLLSPKGSWTEMQKLLTAMKDGGEAERIRRALRSCATKSLLGNWGEKGRAFLIANEFKNPEYDMENIISSCYAIFSA